MKVSNKKSIENNKIRVSAFIDGFNLYHAIDDLGRDDLKWVNLRKLVEIFTNSEHVIVNVFYFTAIAEWLNEPAKRHKAYIEALKLYGVTPILGSFKAKNRRCNSCPNTWVAHEEKKTDVNIAVSLLREAFHDRFDQAFVISRDSDFTPAFQAVKDLPKPRVIKLIAPPKYRHSKELGQIADKTSSIKVSHLELCRMPKEVKDPLSGLVVSTRPEKYDPPS